jgi:hypothetical protein
MKDNLFKIKHAPEDKMGLAEGVKEFMDPINKLIEEIPQKLKFAYLQYYYLCDFINELNARNSTSFYINDCLRNRNFRNCLAHYGLGQYLSESEIIADDMLKGLTNKAFKKTYHETKMELYEILKNLTEQIKTKILR